MLLEFVPVAPGEVPGDPDLGGWRPLPKSLFRRPVTLEIPSASLSLALAVKLVSFAARYLKLKRQLQVIAIELATGPHHLKERGC